MALTKVHTSLAPSPIGPYSQGIVVDARFIYTAGQIAIDPASGQLIDGDIKEQTRRVLKNIEQVLIAAGSSMKNVVKTTVFLKDMGELIPARGSMHLPCPSNISVGETQDHNAE